MGSHCQNIHNLFLNNYLICQVDTMVVLQEAHFVQARVANSSQVNRLRDVQPVQINHLLKLQQTQWWILSQEAKIVTNKF